MKITIGANIKRLRNAKGITQEQLSTAMNVSCAAVSKWERGETYPDITLLQPLAFFFEVTLDELMGYDREKEQAKIDEVIALYWRQIISGESRKARETIVQAYREYPNDYWIMHHYMWNIGGDMADNNPEVLIAHKEEFLSICDKILGGCTEETLRLNAWNMRAKILHAEGKTEEALEIYKTKFADWYATFEQKTEQLFAKNTSEYYFHVRKNMYELADFAADKLGRTVFFNPSETMDEKTDRALRYGNLLLDAFEKYREAFFLVLARTFLSRMENDLFYRGGTDEQVIAVMDRALYATKKQEELRTENAPLDHSLDRRPPEIRKNFFQYVLQYHSQPVGNNKRRLELLKNPDYQAVLKKYQSEDHSD